MVQVVEMTHEEKMSMYMKLPKKQLAEMLIECNRIIEKIGPVVLTNQKEVEEETRSMSDEELLGDAFYEYWYPEDDNYWYNYLVN